MEDIKRNLYLASDRIPSNTGQQFKNGESLKMNGIEYFRITESELNSLKLRGLKYHDMHGILSDEYISLVS